MEHLIIRYQDYNLVGTRWDWSFTPFIPNSMSIMTRGNDDDSFKNISVSGKGILIIKTRAYNECGCSLWKDATFQVKNFSHPKEFFNSNLK